MSLPYFPMFPSDFEAKTSHLTMAEDGAYNRLLRICWMTPGCTIPTDEAWIMRRARAHTDDEKDAVRAVLAEFFKVENGRYSNAKLIRIWAEANEAHERRKNAGSKGGKAKALKTNNSTSSNAVAKPKQPEPEPEPEPDIREEPYGSSCEPAPANDLSQAVSRYNAAAEKAGWPRVQKLTPSRSKQLRGRLKDCAGLDGWEAALHKAFRSDFLCGRTNKDWTGFSFDWLTKQANFTKLMEGNYDNRANNSQQISNRPENRADPALEQILRLAGLGQTSGNGGR